MFKNIAIYRENKALPSDMADFWSTENLGSFAGNLAYAFELSSQFMSVRLTAKKTINFQYLCFFGLIGIGFLYYFNALTFQMAFPRSELEQHDTFTLYRNEGWLYSNLIYLFIPLSFYYFVMNSIMSAETIETVPCIRKLVQSEGQTSRLKLVIMRCLIWAVPVSVTLVTDNIVDILNVGGSVFSPFVSSFIPVRKSLTQVYLYYAYMQDRKLPVGTGRKIFDACYVCVTGFIAFLGIRNLFLTGETVHPV